MRQASPTSSATLPTWLIRFYAERSQPTSVEQPTKFDLVLNLTTAKVLGLTIPESFLLRADEVIE